MVESVEGFILAGGESRRMGTEKSRLILDGLSFVERIARELSAVTSSIKLVGDKAPQVELESQINAPIKIQVVADVYPQWGALGGVHAALSACSESWALIVACDFPLVTSELFACLLGLREDFEAVAPIQEDGIPQPLCSLYRVEPCLRIAEQLIKSRERRPVTLLQSVHTRWVSFGELSRLKSAHSFFDNINTPEDYARVSKKGPGIDDVAMDQ
jgi:molybdopterin-guanine dinucleotide biosynthesis protein A